MKIKNSILFILMLITSTCFAQSLVMSGPMNGYSEMREVMVWVQMTEACTVELEYWNDSIPDLKYRSQSKLVNRNEAFVAHLVADQVEPGQRYQYHILANGQVQASSSAMFFKTQPLWRWRMDPPAFSIAVGSCNYVNQPEYDRPGTGYGSNHQIFQTIEKDSPDMMLWLGDNIYLREADWFTKTGIQRRYTHTRAIPEIQSFLSSTHHYAIWDDHDFGPNDANRTFPHKDKTLDAFKLFWANNGYGTSNTGGITSAFQFNDIHFYLLDNRWNRSEQNMKTQEEQILGKAQIDWLIESLKYSRAPFKMVAIGGQVLNSEKVYENYANYESELEYLLNSIAAEGITGVVFLTGDRHHTELSHVNIQGIDIYDLTVSPLTSGTHKPNHENNANMVEGTDVHEHNYGLLNISGPFKDRTLNIQVKSNQGELIWEKSISEKTK